MAPLPPQNTGRVYFDYVTGNAATSQEHTVMERFAVGVGFDLGDAQQALLDVLTTLGTTAFARGWRVTGVRLSQPGQVFSLPFPLIPALAAFVGAGTALTPYDEAREVTFQGHSQTSGRRVDFSLYGIDGSTPDNFRVVGGGAGLSSLVSAAVAALNANSAAGYFVTIDGTAATWYDYINYNYNSYWEQEIRG